VGLKSDLEQSFKDNLNNSGSIVDVAGLIVDNYKDAVSNGKDSNMNRWSGINYTLIKSAIVAQIKLSESIPGSYMQFTLIEASLIAAWATGSLKLPAIPTIGMSLVDSGVVTISTPPIPPTLPLFEESADYDNITSALFNVFSGHAKTISFLYNGLAVAGAPPPKISVPVIGFTIK